MEQIARKIEGMTLYMCNPETNKECDKRFCMYNTNAVDHLCECTSKKEFALKIGEAAVEKEYTPPGLKKTHFNFDTGDRWVASTIPRNLAHDQK